MKKGNVLLLIEDLFEDVEAVYPYYRLLEEGYEVNIVGPEANKEYKGKKGLSLKSDMAVDEANLDNVDCMIIPGGYAPDRMRRNKNMVNLVKEALNSCKVIGSICHGPWMLAEADIIKGRKVTGFFSISTDLKNAGAEYLDQEVVVDDNIITSRNPGDLPIFCKSIIALLEAY